MARSVGTTHSSQPAYKDPQPRGFYDSAPAGGGVLRPRAQGQERYLARRRPVIIGGKNDPKNGRCAAYSRADRSIDLSRGGLVGPCYQCWGTLGGQTGRAIWMAFGRDPV